MGMSYMEVRSYMIEEVLEQYLEVDEWQIKGIQDALLEADSPGAIFVDHDELLSRCATKTAR